MDGSSVDDDWVLASAPDEPRTLVLVGCIGTGKSATGNSILQKKAFVSGNNSAGVTSACELHTTVLEDGQVLNVIDTPGLFNATVDNKCIVEEIVNCVNMAKDGIHAVLVVLSVWKPFTEEQEAAISSLWTLFGKKIADHMIVIFTGGDELEFSGKTLEEYVGDSESLKELLHKCEDRWVVFNNRTRDQRKKDEQVEDLLSLVNLVVVKNGGKPYMDELSVELKKEARKLYDQTEEVSDPENQNELFLKLKQEARELHDQTKVICDQENHSELSVELKKEARKLCDQREEVSDPENQNELSVELKKEAGEHQDQTREVSDQDNRNESSVELKKEVRKLHDLTEEVSDQEDHNSGHVVNFLLFITLSCVALAIILKF